MIQLKLNNIQVPLEIMKFSDGATGVKLGNGALPFKVESAQIYARISDKADSDTLFCIACIVDIIRNINNRANIELFLPYVPYARQDRRMVKNDSFTLKVFASMLNSLQLDSVITFDVHSEVTGALINNHRTITQDKVVGCSPLNTLLRGTDNFVLVAPDAGSLKKIDSVAKVTSPLATVWMNKHRDTTTGNIMYQKLHDTFNSVAGSRCVIVDDICDGGATFIGAAKELMIAGAESVELYVTHGLFSKGVDHLFLNGISRIYTTDSVYYGAERPDLTIVSCTSIASMYFRG